MSSLPKSYLTPEQYLEIERKAEFKSEYYQGEMYAMSGGRHAHNRLAFNLIGLIGAQIRHGSCQGYTSDMRVHIPSTGLYTYPDVTVVCGEPQFADDTRDTLLNPNLVVEVLSPSTEAYDRGRKFEHYRSVASVNEYLLVSSDRVSAELFTRQEGDGWLLTAAGRLEDSLELKTIGCRIVLADVYEKVELQADTLIP